jgi:hypothetical protein
MRKVERTHAGDVEGQEVTSASSEVDVANEDGDEVVVLAGWCEGGLPEKEKRPTSCQRRAREWHAPK